MHIKIKKPLGLTLVLLLLNLTAHAADSKSVVVKITTLRGMPIMSFPAKFGENVYIHLFDNTSGEELRCNVDLDINQFLVSDESGEIIFKVVPDCRTNLGGVLSAYFLMPKPGKFLLSAIPAAPNIEILTQEIVVK